VVSGQVGGGMQALCVISPTSGRQRRATARRAGAIGGRRPRGDPRRVKKEEKRAETGSRAALQRSWGMGSRQAPSLQEVTQIRAQNDRNPEALATYGRK